MAQLYQQKNYKKLILILNPQEKEFDKIGKCLICFSENFDIITLCNHTFCLDCFFKWYIIDEKDNCYNCNDIIAPMSNKCFIKKGITFDDNSIVQDDINQIEI